jgi:hypothetical protein
MQKIFTFWCLFLLGSTFVQAQNGYRPAYPLEVGIQLGTAQFLGDLGGAGAIGFDSDWQKGLGAPFIVDTDIESVRPVAGLFARYNLGGHFAARLDINYLQLAGDDKYAGLGQFDAQTDILARDPGTNALINPVQSAAFYRFYRNLHFRSHVFEVNLAAEIIPYNFELGNGYSEYSVLSPYGFIGIGVFAFNPQAVYNGAWVDLQPLATEGQGLVDGRAPYELVQFNVPVGFGVKWSYNDTWALSFEVGHRITFTDYIDDVSTYYVDPDVYTSNFDAQTAAMAIALSRRSVEIDPGEVNAFITDARLAPLKTDGSGERQNLQRGDKYGNNDSYYTVSIRFSYYIDVNSLGGGGNRYGCPVW